MMNRASGTQTNTDGTDKGQDIRAHPCPTSQVALSRCQYSRYLQPIRGDP